MFNIILGAVLIVVGVIGESPWGQAVGGGVWGSYAIEAGAAMMAGGVVQMLTPTPHGLGSADTPANTPNYAFNGAINTQAQGRCVPVLYGEGIVGSAVISAGILSKDDIRTNVSSGKGSMGAGIGGFNGPNGKYKVPGLA